MKKIISFVGLFAVLGVGIDDAHGVAMSAQVRRLLQEKQEKIEQLEKCEGKKQGWMIAGISTIGLTAVGVGVNIAQASKSNRLSDEIEMEKSALEKEQNNLNRINNDIAAEHAKQAQNGGGNSQGGGGSGGSSVPAPAAISGSLDASVDGDYCYYAIDGHLQYDLDCDVSNPGDWKVKFKWGIAEGVAACSDLYDVVGGGYGKASNQGRVDEAYTNMATSSPQGKFCYCKMNIPKGSSWILGSFSDADAAACARYCTQTCASQVGYNQGFRKMLFDE